MTLEELHAKQTRHPAYKAIPLELMQERGVDWAVQMFNAREEGIAAMTEDPLLHGFDPPHWRLVDLWVARKRKEYPGACLEVFVLGGHDSGKTNGWTQRIARHFWFTQNAMCWGLHSTEAMSVTVQQARMWTYFPKAIKHRVNAKGGMANALDQKMKYTEGGGFTNMGFNLRWGFQRTWDDATKKPPRLGGRMEFKVYGGSVENLQGSKLTAATSDELIDKDIAKTVKQRIIPRAQETAEPWFLHLIDRCIAILEDVDADGFPKRQLPPDLQGALYHGVHGMGFTPMSGYSPLVAQELDGAATVMERAATVDVPVDTIVPPCFPTEPMGIGKKRVHLLPRFDEKGRHVGTATVPIMRQPLAKTHLVCYLPTNANPWTNIPGKLQDMEGQSEDYIRLTWFGDVRKQWDTLFATFDHRKHVVPFNRLPSKATLDVVIDPGARKPWVFGFYLTDPAGRKFKAMEWPQPDIAIDGAMPGAWAVTSEHGLRNGDAGPAQKLKLNWGRAHYVHLLWSLLQRLHQQFADAGTPWQGQVVTGAKEWKDRPEWKLEGPFIKPNRVLIDSRFAGQHTESKGETKPLLEALYDEEHAIDFEPASGVDLKEGDTLIITELADNSLGMPSYQVCEQCQNTVFMYDVYAVPETSDKPTRKDDKCKDYRDTDAYWHLSGPQYADPDRQWIFASGRK